MFGRKKKVQETRTYLLGRPLNASARGDRGSGGVGVPGMEHAGDHRYHFRKGKWVLKPEYEAKKE